ncbi:hypothetical protein AWB76_03851 [Caballeronia temeraria]|uniref:Lipoprotein n=1 Tax=Caballeronia temeraria TaxID=1777137 RepID=A0A158B8W8_9BURK|nr:hypothetical protein [Caballeronia temeraria]SAK66522.1 hypothetical protein AWB76_03851 [Caballeronia temeraria]
MSTVASRHILVACFVVCVCASVCGCGERAAQTSTPVDATNDAPAATQTSELQDWAKQATTRASDQPTQPAMARAASEPLATPVIHTVD